MIPPLREGCDAHQPCIRTATVEQRGASLVPQKLPLKMRRCGITAGIGNLAHCLVRLRQQAAGAGDAQFIHILRHGAAGAFLEQAVEGALAQAGHRRQRGHIDRLGEMRHDVGDDGADAVGGSGADGSMKAWRGDLL